MWTILLTAAALAQSPCSWTTASLVGGGFRVAGEAQGAGAPPSVGVYSWGEDGPVVQARIEGEGPLQIAVTDATLVLRGALDPDAGALYPTALMDLPGGVQIDASAPVDVRALGPEGLRIAARLPTYTPVTPAEATVACDALSLAPGEARLPPYEEFRRIPAGTWTVRAAPGGAALGTLRCTTDGACPVARPLRAEGGQSQVELRWNGALLVGWLPDKALLEREGDASGGMVGGQLAKRQRYVCPSMDLWVADEQGRAARVGRLQDGAVVERARYGPDFVAIYLLEVGWLHASPNELALALADLDRCQPVDDAYSAMGGVIGTPGAYAPVVWGALPRSEIDRVLTGARTGVEACAQAGRREQPELFGRVHTRFVIGADGTVLDAVIVRSTLKSGATVERCIAGAMSVLSFPKPEDGGIVVVSYPVLLGP